MDGDNFERPKSPVDSKQVVIEKDMEETIFDEQPERESPEIIESQEIIEPILEKIEIVEPRIDEPIHIHIESPKIDEPMKVESPKPKVPEINMSAFKTLSPDGTKTPSLLRLIATPQPQQKNDDSNLRDLLAYRKEGKPDFSELSHEKKLEAKVILKFKVESLKRHSTRVEVPDFDGINDLDILYEFYVKGYRTVLSEKNALYFKIAAVVFWVVVEIGLTQLGIDCSGLSSSQMAMMESYEELFLELGEDWIGFFDAKGSALLKLCVFSGFSMIMFVGLRMVEKWIGGRGNADQIYKGVISLFMGGKLKEPLSETPPETTSDEEKTEQKPNNGGFDLGNFNLGGLVGGIAKMLGGLQNNAGSKNQKRTGNVRRPPFRDDE